MLLMVFSKYIRNTVFHESVNASMLPSEMKIPNFNITTTIKINKKCVCNFDHVFQKIG